eukprot:3135887-Prymnesium_polylepis.1
MCGAHLAGGQHEHALLAAQLRLQRHLRQRAKDNTDPVRREERLRYVLLINVVALVGLDHEEHERALTAQPAAVQPVRARDPLRDPVVRRVGRQHLVE